MSALPANIPSADPTRDLLSPEEQSEVGGQGWLLRKMTPRHQQICAFMAQGMKRGHIAQACGCTPEYVTMLAKQPLIQQYIRDMCATAGIQLEGQFSAVVDAVGETLQQGNYKEKMQAARLHGELTKRLGPGSGAEQQAEGSAERLLRLAERLVSLNASRAPQHNSQSEQYEDAEFRVVQDGDERPGDECGEPAQDASSGQDHS
jgi:hypothetical protein